MRVFIGVLLACSVVAGCDDSSTTSPTGEGGEAGEGGAGGEGGAAGGGGAGQITGDSCDHLTRCTTPGAVCRPLPDSFDWGCFELDVPVGEECEGDYDCQGDAVEGYCTRGAFGTNDRICSTRCYADSGCPDGMVCGVGGFTLCEVPEE